MLKIFNLALKLNGFPIQEANTELQKILAIPEEEYVHYIEQKKMEIFNFHLQNNPFYKELVGTASFKNWSDLPILNKGNLQKPLQERLSMGYTSKNTFVNKTSGSSGNPFVFAKDKFCHALIWVNIMRRFQWHGIDFNHSYQARFYGMPLDFVSNKKLRIKDFLSHRYRFTIFDLSDKGLEKIVRKFSNSKFDYINGYTSSIVLLANYLKKNDLFLDTICPTLKVCIVTSEMLFEEDKMLLEERFRIPIVNEYGAAELDVIALESAEGEWKVNAETIFVEILDENNQVVPYGTAGRIVVTSLYNKAHPMIRYEVGDMGILDEKSTLKNPILKKLIGRTNDIAVLPSGKIAPGMTFYSITKKLFGDQGNVKEFVIKQTKLDTFEIEYTSDVELNEKEINNIKTVFSNYLEPHLYYFFIRKKVLERGKSGKLKQFISLL
ncbi:phenylacetate--CoA ligase family protein [Flavobacterium sp. ZT3R18]|uniref:phenylacetate--CoA ligase family protein n=1 Tax=Flavobacterium sp. ZT3R18 TaxID=2594429 RepID=UPI001179DF32|nr:phenylacetate--CoA ligase family protein [Flavobacterium sp. ZT3R18]TRX37863.1 phenylacetate--CoA ligase family protein [Flavobacterium sp. ZT3R18]